MSDLLWFRPRPESSREGRGLIDERGRLHTWPALSSDHATEASDRGVQIASRLWIDPDGRVRVTGGHLPESEAISIAVEQDPRLRR